MSNPDPLLEYLRAEVERVVLGVTTETSDKFVPAPKKDEILADLLIGLKRFSNTVRWKEFFQLNPNSNNQPNDPTDSDDDFDDVGLSTGLKPSSPTAAPPPRYQCAGSLLVRS